MTTVLVCGGREFKDRPRLFAVLDSLNKERGIDKIVTGAANGADTIGLAWALSRQIRFEGFPAEWDRHGRSAGHRRNQRMLDETDIDIVVAAPGGRGTANMIARANAAKIPVKQA